MAPIDVVRERSAHQCDTFEVRHKDLCGIDYHLEAAMYRNAGCVWRQRRVGNNRIINKSKHNWSWWPERRTIGRNKVKCRWAEGDNEVNLFVAIFFFEMVIGNFPVTCASEPLNVEWF